MDPGGRAASRSGGAPAGGTVWGDAVVTRWRRIVAAVALAGLPACVARGPLSEGVDTSGRRLVLVLDRSTSMRDNDPDDAARAGVELALALAGARDNVGVLTFAEDAEAVVPLRPAGGAAAREAARQALAGIERHGVSNVGRALERAREMLEAGGAPAGSWVVFLTDGVPYRQARGRRLSGGPGVDEAVAAIAAKGYRIFAIALGRGASTPFLSRLVASTGGAVVVARDPGELVAAFETVAVEALGYLRAERGDALIALPHTRRLAFLGRWDGAGRVGVVLRDGAPVEEGGLVRTPAQGPGPFSVALVEAPEAGAWRADLQGARETVLLLEPGFAVDLLPTPPVVASGAAVPVTVRLQGDPDVVARARASLRLRGRVEGGAGSSPAWTPLTPGEAAALRAPQAAEETAVRVVVEAEVTLGGRTYQVQRTRALTVQPGGGAAPVAGAPVAPTPLPLRLSVRPRSFSRLVWEDDALDAVRLTVRGDPSRATTVRCGDATLALPPGGSGVLVAPCPADGALTVTAEAQGEDAPPFRLQVQGDVRRHRLTPERVVLPATPAGVAARPLAVATSLEAAGGAAGAGAAGGPAGRAIVAPGALRLVGPSGHEVPVERGEEGWVSRPPADTPAGLYRGAVVVVVEEPRGLRSREVPVELEVLAPVRPPEAVSVHGAWGWVSRPIEVAWPTLDEVAVTITPGPLAGDGATIHPELDIRVVPLDGWSGARLSHEPRRFALQVFLSSDLPAGVYRGAVEVAVDGRALSIPVELEVRR